MLPNEYQFTVEEDLLLRYIGGHTTCEESGRVARWMQESTDNEELVIQLYRIYYAQRTKERIQKRNARWAFGKVEQRIRKKTLRTQLKWIAVSAACLLLLISVGANYFLYNDQHVEPQFVTVQTNAGMRTNLTLPDGTLVHLNSASKLVYPVPFDHKERRVLLEGEGFFEVTSDPTHPFIVSVAEDKMRIKVVGTRFNINAYPHEREVYTTLVNGSIVLQFTDASKKLSEKQLDSDTEYAYNLVSRNVVVKEKPLVPNEKATYNMETKRLTVREVLTENEYKWKDGMLIFKNTPMPEVLSKLSNFYNVKFEVLNPVINTYPFAGTFDNRQLFQVLDYLRQIHKIDYTVHEATEDDSNGRKYTIITLNKHVKFK